MDEARSHRHTVRGVEMAWREQGAGRPIVLLHGNPTSSYLWRHVLPVVARHGRAIAPDLLGMGDSGRLAVEGPGSYSFTDHRDHLDDLLTALGVDEGVVLIAHDWGGALGLDWARRHADHVRGVAFMEAVVRPRSWSEEDEGGVAFFRSLRGPDGERRVLQDNVFVEEVLAAATRDLAEDDLAVYRAAWAEPGEARRPMLAWARAIPFDGEPANVHAIVAASAAWLEKSSVPKLFVAADPGAILVGDARRWCASLPNVEVVTVDAGHFVPEDAPDALTAALDDWLNRLG